LIAKLTAVREELRQLVVGSTASAQKVAVEGSVLDRTGVIAVPPLAAVNHSMFMPGADAVAVSVFTVPSAHTA
jgi:hypothetical protein